MNGGEGECDSLSAHLPRELVVDLMTPRRPLIVVGRGRSNLRLPETLPK